MSVSFNKVVSAIIEFLPPAVQHQGITRAMGTIAPVLNSCCSSYYLEWHLAAPQRSDLLCSLTFNSRNQFGRRHPAGKRIVPSRNGWDTAGRFIDTWELKQEQLCGRIPHVWLAFDYNHTAGAFDPPNIHCCIDKQFTDRQRSPAYVNYCAARTFDRILEILTKDSFSTMPPSLFTAMKKSYRKLADIGGEALHLSFMHNRTPPVGKLNMTVPSSRLAELLDSMHWQGDVPAVTAICHEFTQDEPRVKGNICLTGSTCGRFELELEYNQPLLYDNRRIAMLQTMVRHNCATGEQVRQICKWPGRSEITYRKESFVIDRWLDVKICFDPAGAITAKPYFGFAPFPPIGWNRAVPND